MGNGHLFSGPFCVAAVTGVPRKLVCSWTTNGANLGFRGVWLRHLLGERNLWIAGDADTERSSRRIRGMVAPGGRNLF